MARMVLFLDESGDHNLKKIDSNYPLFILGGVIMDYGYAFGEFSRVLANLKERIFGGEKVILHSSDIRRNRRGFEILKSPDKRDAFYQEINRFIEEADFKIIAVAIDKQEHLNRYGPHAYNPYHFALEVIVERFIFELRSLRMKGMIYAESRGPQLDMELLREWNRISQVGTAYTKGEHVRINIIDFKTVNKAQNIAGLQIADLVLYPLGRYVLGRACTPDVKIVLRKLRRGPNGSFEGYGLVRLPRK